MKFRSVDKMLLGDAIKLKILSDWRRDEDNIDLFCFNNINTY